MDIQDLNIHNDDNHNPIGRTRGIIITMIVTQMDGNVDSPGQVLVVLMIRHWGREQALDRQWHQLLKMQTSLDVLMEHMNLSLLRLRKSKIWSRLIRSGRKRQRRKQKVPKSVTIKCVFLPVILHWLTLVCIYICYIT